jgi:hypothetical protein
MTIIASKADRTIARYLASLAAFVALLPMEFVIHQPRGDVNLSAGQHRHR